MRVCRRLSGNVSPLILRTPSRGTFREPRRLGSPGYVGGFLCRDGREVCWLLILRIYNPFSIVRPDFKTTLLTARPPDTMNTPGPFCTHTYLLCEPLQTSPRVRVPSAVRIGHCGGRERSQATTKDLVFVFGKGVIGCPA